MKVKVEIDPSLKDPEIILRYPKKNSQIEELEQILLHYQNKSVPITFYQEGKEYYISLKEILFFETEAASVIAHTGKEVYLVKQKLYTLEENLPYPFVRISKSAIINIDQILSIEQVFPSNHLISFQHSHKQVYVSRMYYKALKHKLEERRTL